MKYTQEIEIDLPRERVLELFVDTDNLPKWQEGFVSMTPRSGQPGHPGAVSDMVYQMGKRRIEMTETVTRRDLPDHLDGIYEAKGVKNWIYNQFEDVGGAKTRWISTNEFQFGGMMKVIGFLMPGAFRKQSMKYMVMFKDWAESLPR